MNMGKGYYSVTIHNGTDTEVHTVFAPSDYAAAIKVRNLTGRMARSESDVIYIDAHAPAWRAATLHAALPAIMCLGARA